MAQPSLDPKIAEKLRSGAALTMEEERKTLDDLNRVLGHWARANINDLRKLFAHDE